MLKELAKPLQRIVKNPFTLLPALVFGAVISVLAEELAGHFLEIFFRVIVFGEFPESTPIELPLYFINRYLLNVLGIAVIGFLIIVVSAMVFFAYARLCKGSKGVIESILHSIGRIWDAITIALFVFIALAIYSTAVGFLYWLILLSAEIGLLDIMAMILAIILAFLGLYVLVKLSFLPIVMGMDDLKLKEGITKTWNWSQKRLLGIIAVLLFVSFAGSLVTALPLGLFEGINDPLAYYVIFAIFSSIASAYSALAMSEYYLSK